MDQLKSAAYSILFKKEFHSSLKRFVLSTLVITIILSVFCSVLETEPLIFAQYSTLFSIIEIFATTIFILEYILRLWCIGEDEKYNGILGRVKYALTPTALLDLITIMPFFLSLSLDNVAFTKILRLLRIIRLMKLGAFSESIEIISVTIKRQLPELLVSLGLAIALILFASSIIYLVESAAQPEQFGSIPRAMWWAVVTLTTVGYGDMYPITPLGKLLAASISFFGIALVALPAGILASGFTEVHRNMLEKKWDEKK